MGDDWMSSPDEEKDMSSNLALNIFSSSVAPL